MARHEAPLDCLAVNGTFDAARRGSWGVVSTDRVRLSDDSRCRKIPGVEPPSTEAVTIPVEALSEDALRGVVEAFVLREGTDYGAREFTLAEKVQHVMSQLRRAEARIVYNPLDQSIDILPT